MATTKSDLMKLLKEESPRNRFVPYSYLSKEADALTVYFEADPDYSERLNEHVTLYRSIDTNELVGCRIKGISGILEDLPNYIHVDHDGIELSVLFFSFRGSITDEVGRNALKGLAHTAREKKMTLQPC